MKTKMKMYPDGGAKKTNLEKAQIGGLVKKGYNIAKSIFRSSRPVRKAKIVTKKNYPKVKENVTKHVKNSANKIITGALMAAGAHAYNALSGKDKPNNKPLPKPKSKPKAMYGMSIKKPMMQKGGSPEDQIKRKMITTDFENLQKIVKAKSNNKKPSGKI